MSWLTCPQCDKRALPPIEADSIATGTRCQACGAVCVKTVDGYEVEARLKAAAKERSDALAEEFGI